MPYGTMLLGRKGGRSLFNSNTKRAAARLAGRAALTAAQRGLALYQKRALNKMRRPRRRGFIATEGKYTGKIRFPKKKPTINKDIYAKKGSRGQIENNFVIDNGTTVAYAGFTSFIRNPTGSDKYASLPFQIGMAMLRNMLKRHYNCDIESPLQTFSDLNLVGTVVGSAAAMNPYKLVFIRRSYPIGNGSLATNIKPVFDDKYTITFDVSNRMADIAQLIAVNVLTHSDFGANGPIQDTLGSVSLPIARELYGYYFIDIDETGREFRKPNTRLDTQYFKASSTVEVYFQNQTKSDSNQPTIDVIDSNPIKGRIYYFSNPYPMVRTYNSPDNTYEWKLMADVNADGVIYPDTSLSGAWGQLPKADMFTNLKTYDDISLQPGELKKFTFQFKFNGLINKFISGLKTNNLTGTTVPGTINSKYQVSVGDVNALGTSVLFAFEKRLSSGDGNPVVMFQRNVWTSAVLTKRKLITMLPLATGEIATGIDDTA